MKNAINQHDPYPLILPLGMVVVKPFPRFLVISDIRIKQGGADLLVKHNRRGSGGVHIYRIQLFATLIYVCMSFRSISL